MVVMLLGPFVKKSFGGSSEGRLEGIIITNDVLREETIWRRLERIYEKLIQEEDDYWRERLSRNFRVLYGSTA